MAHTPGQWFIGISELDPDEWDFDGTVWAAPLEQDVKGWEASGKQGPDPGPLLIAEHIDHKDDAVLIAQSPALLAAAERMFAAMETAIHHCIWEYGAHLVEAENAHDQLLAAISKAKGEQA